MPQGAGHESGKVFQGKKHPNVRENRLLKQKSASLPPVAKGKHRSISVFLNRLYGSRIEESCFYFTALR